MYIYIPCCDPQAGHAIAAHSQRLCEDAIKVSIVPRGGALGYCQTREPRAATARTRAYYLSQVAS